MSQIMIEKLIDLETLERVAPIIRNSAHPLRLRILEFLGQSSEPRTVSEIVEVCGGASQSVVSQQLRILRDQAVLSASREGHNVFYTIEDRSILFLLECIRVHSGMSTSPSSQSEAASTASLAPIYK